MRQIKVNYLAPMVEILNVRVEKGFTNSSLSPQPTPEPSNGRLAGSLEEGNNYDGGNGGEGGPMFT